MKYLVILFSAFLLVACKRTKKQFLQPMVLILQALLKTLLRQAFLPEKFRLKPFHFLKKLKNAHAISQETKLILKPRNTSMQMMPEKQRI